MTIDTSALGFNWNKDEGTLSRIGAVDPEAKPTVALSARSSEAIREEAIEALRTVRDPEIPLNIYDLGLIYDLVTEPAGFIDVKMTLTSPMCPAVGSLPPEVKYKLGKVEGVQRVDLELVWDPPWTKERMSEAARLELNLD